MSDIDRIKDRVRKLMAYANDGAASDAEIENAMAHAAALIDKHHIDASEVRPGAEPQPDNVSMGDTFGTSQKVRFSTWENTLAYAICDLFGCVDWYVSHAKDVLRVNGIAEVDKAGTVRRGCRVCFYGPAVEAAEAAELFTEWSRSIATMGVVRWGGAFRGDGAMYCLGFSSALSSQAKKIQTGRGLIQAKAPASLVGHQTTAITLSKRYEILKTEGARWIKEERGIHLSKSGGGRGYGAGSSDAYNEGKSHGASTTFSRHARARQLPGF